MNQPYQLLKLVCLPTLLTALVMAISFNAIGQDVVRCYTMESDSMYRAKYDLPPMEDFEKWLQPKVEAYKQRQGNRRATVVTLPVVFHIIHNGSAVGSGANISNEQVLSQIEVLNEDFRRTNEDTSNTRAVFRPVAADCEMEFCLGGINRVDRNAEGWSAPPYTKCMIDDSIKPATIWDPEQYINVWVIPGLQDCAGVGILGYSTWPESSILNGVPNAGSNIEQRDGIVVVDYSVGRPPANPNGGAFNLGRTATHELGHFFGLLHVWGDGDCGASDFCDDTPNSNGPNYDCPFDSNGCIEIPELPDMVENYLDYSDDACMNTFTEDQKDRMRTVLALSPRRTSLITANTCCPTDFASASVASDYDGEDISCAGGRDGEATASTSGGTAPYTYEWSNGQTTQTATGLAAGTYEVTVTDDLGCQATASVTLTDPPAFSATASVTSDYSGEDISCHGASDGEAKATGNGGTGSYTYLWGDGQTTQVATGLAAGTYSVTITDARGCEATASVTLTEPDPVSASAAPTTNYNGYNISCHGGSDGAAEVSAEGGVTPYSYEWDAHAGGQTIAEATGLSAGTYSVTVTDANDCEATASVTLTEPDPVSASAAPTTNYNGYNISCHGGSDGAAEVTVSGGVTPYSYAWDANAGGQTTAEATGLSAGTYSVTVTDANDCEQTATVTLTEPDELLVDAGANQTVYYGYPDSACADLEVASASGGVPPYTYSWSDGAAGTGTNVCPTATTDYTVTITDANGCTATDEVRVCVIDVHCGNNPKNHKVEICHMVSNAPQSLCVNIKAVPAHLLHGDLLGNCNVDRSCNPAAAKWSGSEETASGAQIKAYPNPFSQETNILFTVEKDGFVTLELFDVSGRKIARLFNSEVDAGHTYSTTVGGHQLSAGLYFCKLRFADGTSETKKLLYTP